MPAFKPGGNYSIYFNRTFARWGHFTTKTRILCVFSFLLKFLFPLGINKTIGPNNMTKESGQSILAVVVFDTIM